MRKHKGIILTAAICCTLGLVMPVCAQEATQTTVTTTQEAGGTTTGTENQNTEGGSQTTGTEGTATGTENQTTTEANQNKTPLLDASGQEVDPAKVVKEFKGVPIIVLDDQGRYVIHPSGNTTQDSIKMEEVLSTDEVKTFVIPSGMTLYISQVIGIGDNTTILAEGATIVQIANGKGVLTHAVDGGNYNAIKNVNIIGGTWTNKNNSKACTMMRFAHGSNITIQNATIDTNYKGHGLELIACKDVLVDGCTIVAKNEKTKSSKIREEAVQIDVASPKTAPGIVNETHNKSYVAGQTCRNITIQNSTVAGSRGICANFTHDAKYMNRPHYNIKIDNCTVTGYTAEAIALFNTLGSTVTNNQVKTFSKDKKNSYSVGIHMIFMKKIKDATKYKDVITGNTAYGNYAAIEVATKTKDMKRGPVTIQNNQTFCKQGKERCIRTFYCKKVKESKNKKKKW